jgi:hypothetical protein
MIRTPRTLHVERAAPPSRDRARSREEALSRLVVAEYDTIVLHTRTPGHDDYQLVAYLAGTWPHFLRTLTVRSVCGGATHVWNAATARFDREFTAPPPPRHPFREREEVQQIAAV